jgi:inhibitor of KinA
MRYQRPLFRIMGDRSLLVELGDEISPSLNRLVRKLFIALTENPIAGLVETIPAYRSLLVTYDALVIDVAALTHRIEELQGKAEGIEIPEPKTVEIPVAYGGACGPDLEWVAQYHKITPHDVIQLHTGSIYQVYMIGFTPGFSYMGELPEQLAVPRRETPRIVIPEGSVAIAQRQTGIYPVESPGGWYILGRTPLKLFNPTLSPPALLEMGDRVRFFPIADGEYRQWTR